MSVYTVHQPRPKGDSDPDPERFVFVRDGFYFWAFILGPLWMLWRRLWLVLLLYIVLMVLVQAGMWYLRVGGGVQFSVGFLIALLVGFEAGTLRRWTLSIRGWKTLGVVVGDDVESAERRFFSAWVAEDGGTAVAHDNAPPPAPMRMPQSRQPEVIGLFPEPGANR